ncbi:P63C domain-containing protein [Chloroflexota bacterium]
MTDKPNRNAKALSKLGASKGGNARASVLTPEERREIAQKAVRTRWAKAKGIPIEEVGQVSSPLDQVLEITKPQGNNQPLSAFQGELKIGDVSFACHVLNDFRRVLAQREVVGILTGNKKGGLARYLKANALQDYIDIEKIAEHTIEFAIPGSQYKATGYEATLLVEICDAYLRARDDNKLSRQQDHLAKQAEIIIRACAKVGIIALIDEATGYQEIRAKNALQLKLQAYISDELQEWARMFPQEFFFELARLENIHYSPRNRPIRWGKYILAFVYAAVDEDVAKELKRRIPNPHKGQNLHQLLRKVGREKVSAQVNQVLGVMKTCKNMDDFKRAFDRIFKGMPTQIDFFDAVDIYSKN